jgi:hypothetical protein
VTGQRSNATVRCGRLVTPQEEVNPVAEPEVAEGLGVTIG